MVTMRPLRKSQPHRGNRRGAQLASSSDELGLTLDDVVAVFACNERFVPYLSVALQSIIENASPNRHYDIIVLTRDITPASMLALTRQADVPNVFVGFLDVDAALGDLQLPHHGHFRPETYFRLLAPSLLANVDKAIYLDSDLVVNADIAELYDIDVTGYLLGATLDADTVGQSHGYDLTVRPYLARELGLSDPDSYFQAGVLLMNLDEFRRQTTPQQLLGISTERMWRWLDQDVLNKIVDGKYRKIHMRWNYLYDWEYMRRSHIVIHAPAYVQAEYDEARRNPCIVHYAGPDNRPWLYPQCDFAGLFWRYARHSPYLEELRAELEESHHSTDGTLTRLRALVFYTGAMPTFDLCFPVGSPRRRRMIKGYQWLGGNIG